jgi:hypothetical protein
MNQNKTIGTLADVLSLIDQTGLTGTRRRDMISAINRICEMAGTTPECMCAELPVLKEMLSRIGPAAQRGQRQELLEPKEPSGCGT